MDVTKARRFNERMGKAKHYPRHQNLAKGGMVDRKKFAFGDAVQANPMLRQSNQDLTNLQQGQVDTNYLNAATPGANPVGGDVAQGGVLGSLASQNLYRAQLAPTTTLNYQPGFQAGQAQALNQQPVNQAIAAEQGLAGQYGDIAAGRGPNPAMAALNQQTGQNVANQAALAAGQRGGASNVGLLARQAAQTGAATQQQAVGQAATLQANQQIGALGAQGGLQNQIAQQGLGEQGVGAQVYGVAGGANTGQNNTNVANYQQAQSLNQATATGNAQNSNNLIGGLIGGAGAALAALHEGGEVQHFANGGGPSLGVDTTIAPVAIAPIAPVAAPVHAPATAQSVVGAALQGGAQNLQPIGANGAPADHTGLQMLGKGIGTAIHNLRQQPALNPLDTTPVDSGPGESFGVGDVTLAYSGGEIAKGPHKSHLANYMFADGGMTDRDVPALVSAQEVYLNPHQVSEVVERGADPMKIGHHFPGKDKVSKNSEKNDVIPVTLEDGGVVLPISVTKHKNASEKGRRFVERAHAKRYMKKPKGI